MSQDTEHLYTQKIFPTVNNDDLLEFRIQPNSKGQLDLSNVLLHFTAKVPNSKTGGTKIRAQNQ